MTVRLSAMFEEHIKKILSSWRIAKKRQRRLATSSDDSDVNVCSSESEKSETIKVLVEPIKNGIINYESDSDSDNTPLGVLKAMSRSNTATESDTTLDKVGSYMTLEEGMPSDKEGRLKENGCETFVPEASTSSQSLIDDFDHNYTSKRLAIDNHKPPSTRKKKIDDSDTDKPSTSSSRSRQTEDNPKYTEKESSDDEYRPPRQTRQIETDSSSEDEDSNNTNVPSRLRGKRLNNEYKAPVKKIIKTSSDSDEDSLNLLQVQTGLRKKKASSEDSDGDDDFCPEDTSSSSRSKAFYGRRRKVSSDEDFQVRRRRKSSFVVEEDDDDVASGSSSSDSQSSDEVAPKRKAGLRRRPKKNKHYESSESDSESTSRPQRKKRKVLISETIDSDTDTRRTNGRSGYFGNVSSRGRVRKITERAAAFLKKDKRAG